MLLLLIIINLGLSWIRVHELSRVGSLGIIEAVLLLAHGIRLGLAATRARRHWHLGTAHHHVAVVPKLARCVDSLLNVDILA